MENMNEKLDVIIFGATGFTGEWTVRNAVTILKDFKWGIAGRNQIKLRAVLEHLSHRYKQNFDNIPVISADVDDVNSIENMANQCKLLLNCCGPYRFYGEIVVKSCIEAGTHYIDVTAEPQFINKMHIIYHDMARLKNVYVVTACGFESIPADMGVVYTEKQFKGTINSIEMFYENNFKRESSAIASYGTWKSGIYAVAAMREVFTTQKQLNRDANLPKLRPILKYNPFLPPIQKPAFLKSYFIPFPFTDRTVVHNSQRLHYTVEGRRPIQFESYVGFRSLLVTIALLLVAPFIVPLTFFKCTRKLLLRYPRIFSFGFIKREQDPLEDNMKLQEFSMTFRALGWREGEQLTEPPKQKLITRISGTDFYGITSINALYAAKMILTESDRMPAGGGVLAPGYAFGATSLIDALSQHQNGLKFEVLQ